MTLAHLLLREIVHRKINFGIAFLSVAASAGIAVSAVSLLKDFDRETEVVLQEKEGQTQNAWTSYIDFVRRNNLELGFNLMVVHEDQNLANPDNETKYLPQEYADTLAQTKLATINHVLPFLQQRVRWPEEGDRWVILYGTPGEVHIKNPGKQTPMVEAIKTGQASLGYTIHRTIGLNEGDHFELMGRAFLVQDVRPSEGFEEDEQIRIRLETAQKMLGLQGAITGLKAINCKCAGGPEGLAKIRGQIAQLLPNTKVLEHMGKMVVRAESRAEVAKQAEQDLEREKATRSELRAARQAFNAVLVPLVAVVAAVWLGLMMWDNVRHRRGEIAILRAIGIRNRQILLLVLTKALAIGLFGSAAGFTAGLAIAAARSKTGIGLTGLFDPGILAGCLLGATLLAVAASWLPALLAGQTDPAVVLQKE